MIALNLGCGSRTSPLCVNLDWSPLVRLKGSPLGQRMAGVLLRGERLENFRAMDGDIVACDLRKGIPAETSSVDLVYHSHVLEHIDRNAVPAFLAEVRRVLKPGGVHRVVVPDLERRARAYVASLDAALAEGSAPAEHDATVSDLLEQSVRREAAGSSRQRPLRRRLENLALGDARRRGETHQWMWDRVNLTAALLEAGFLTPVVTDHCTSAVPDWPAYGLDVNPDGSEYKTDSLYMECRG